MRPCLVASYDIRPGNGVVLYWFRRFINMSFTYLLRHLLTLLWVAIPTFSPVGNFRVSF